jgi:hypothetical protein
VFANATNVDLSGRLRDSCRDRHCPRCGGLDQRLWAETQLQHLLPVSYFDVVFTVPASLRPFFAHESRAKAMDALFAAVSESILETAATRGLRPGVLAVLHTWNQRLGAHPHIHCLVAGDRLPGESAGSGAEGHSPRTTCPIRSRAALAGTGGCSPKFRSEPGLRVELPRP